MKKSKIVIAIDFDHTIVKVKNFPHILGLRKFAKWSINKLYTQGNYIIVWTCRHDQHEAQAHYYLESNNIQYNSINRQHPKLIEIYGNDTRKISADIYIDDKNLSFFGLPNWIVIYFLIQIKRYFTTSILEVK